MESKGTLLLTSSEIATLLGVEECMTAVEQAFRLYAEGQTSPPGVLGIHAPDGSFQPSRIVSGALRVTVFPNVSVASATI